MKKISQINVDFELSDMMQNARTINAINQILMADYPHLFNEQSTLAKITEDDCVVVVKSQALAYRIKQQHDLVLQALKSQPKLSHIRCYHVKVAI